MKPVEQAPHSSSLAFECAVTLLVFMHGQACRKEWETASTGENAASFSASTSADEFSPSLLLLFFIYLVVVVACT
jgi:hypothetical protein